MASTSSKKKPTVKASLSYVSCTMFATFDLQCPLCKAMVPAGTKHECSKPEATAGKDEEA